jgi:hypothetical protein
MNKEKQINLHINNYNSYCNIEIDKKEIMNVINRPKIIEVIDLTQDNNNKKIEYINLINPDEDYTINSFDLDLIKNPRVVKIQNNNTIKQKIMAVKNSNPKYGKRKLVAVKNTNNLNLNPENQSPIIDLAGDDEEVKYKNEDLFNSYHNIPALIPRSKSSSQSSSLNLKSYTTNHSEISNIIRINTHDNIMKKTFHINTNNKTEYFDIEYINNYDDVELPYWKVNI